MTDLIEKYLFPNDKSVIAKAVLVVLGTALLDGIFHFFFTSPFETSFYFLVKSVLVYTLAIHLFSMKNITTSEIILHSLIFMFFFSVYYRSLELLTGIHFGARVPDIQMGQYSVKFYEHPYQSAIIWAFIHFMANFIPSYYAYSHFK